MLQLFNIDLKSSPVWVLVIVLLLGFVAIIYSGNKFVDSAIWVSKAAKIPPMIIGATIVSVGTTLPELCVSVFAAVEGSASVAIGNAAGSPLCNAALILGLILAFSVINISREQFAPKMIILLFSVLMALAFVVFDKRLAVFESIILVIIFAVFIGYSLHEAKKNPLADAVIKEEKKQNPWIMIMWFVLGAVGIAIGASCLVDSVTGLAAAIGISEQIIAVSIVAFGTSLPELVTAITCIQKKTPSISLGNIVGANIINITLIMGLSGIISGGTTLDSSDYRIFVAALCVLLATLLIVFIPTIIKKRTYRIQGILSVLIYAGYIAFLII